MPRQSPAACDPAELALVASAAALDAFAASVEQTPEVFLNIKLDFEISGRAAKLLLNLSSTILRRPMFMSAATTKLNTPVHEQHASEAVSAV